MPMPELMVRTVESLSKNGLAGELMFANNKGKLSTWNRYTSQEKLMKRQQNNTKFPAIPAELPGVVVEQAENDQAADVAHQ